MPFESLLIMRGACLIICGIACFMPLINPCISFTPLSTNFGILLTTLSIAFKTPSTNVGIKSGNASAMPSIRPFTNSMPQVIILGIELIIVLPSETSVSLKAGISCGIRSRSDFKTSLKSSVKDFKSVGNT